MAYKSLKITVVEDLKPPQKLTEILDPDKLAHTASLRQSGVKDQL